MVLMQALPSRTVVIHLAITVVGGGGGRNTLHDCRPIYIFLSIYLSIYLEYIYICVCIVVFTAEDVPPNLFYTAKNKNKTICVIPLFIAWKALIPENFYMPDVCALHADCCGLRFLKHGTLTKQEWCTWHVDDAVSACVRARGVCVCVCVCVCV